MKRSTLDWSFLASIAVIAAPVPTFPADGIPPALNPNQPAGLLGPAVLYIGHVIAE